MMCRLLDLKLLHLCKCHHARVLLLVPRGLVFSALLSVIWLEENKPAFNRKLTVWCIFFFSNQTQRSFNCRSSLSLEKRSSGFDVPPRVIIGEAWEGYKKMCWQKLRNGAALQLLANRLFNIHDPPLVRTSDEWHHQAPFTFHKRLYFQV